MKSGLAAAAPGCSCPSPTSADHPVITHAAAAFAAAAAAAAEQRAIGSLFAKSEQRSPRGA